MKDRAHIPFGMLFEEEATENAQDEVEIEYDTSEGLSFVIDPSGARVPFVSETWPVMSTQTTTKVRSESTDIDPGGDREHTQTKTFTAVRNETTDRD